MRGNILPGHLLTVASDRTITKMFVNTYSGLTAKNMGEVTCALFEKLQHEKAFPLGEFSDDERCRILKLPPRGVCKLWFQLVKFARTAFKTSTSSKYFTLMSTIQTLVEDKMHVARKETAAISRANKQQPTQTERQQKAETGAMGAPASGRSKEQHRGAASNRGTYRMPGKCDPKGSEDQRKRACVSLCNEKRTKFKMEVSSVPESPSPFRPASRGMRTPASAARG